MRDNRLLWQYVKLPQWNPERLYALFQKHQSRRPTRTEREEYACQLMVLISANLARKNWIGTLRRHRLDPEDVASDILEFLVTKTPEITLTTPCAPVLLKVLNVAIYRRLVSEIRQHKVIPDDLPSSEAEEGARRYASQGQEIPLIEDLERQMRESEENLCRGHWADQIGICVLYRYLCRQVIRQNTILSYAQLPTRLKKRVSCEQHAVTSYRINKLVHDFAASHRA